jgi:parallel beta-helix repeat protein
MLFKKVISIIVMVLILNGILIPIFKIQRVNGEWTGTVYIRADGSIDPPDAPIITYDFVTYTLTGNLTSSADGMVIERDNIVLDGAKYTIEGTGIYYNGINLSSKTNVTIQNVNIKQFIIGIFLNNSANNRIAENNITSTQGGGIALENSLGNSIAGNNMNCSYGLELVYSSKNNVSGNNIEATDYAVTLFHSSNNSIVGNTFINGLIVENSYGNVVENNTVNDKPLVYLEGASNYAVEGDAGQVILVKSKNITIKGLNLVGIYPISRLIVGIELYETSDSTISKNCIINNCRGIFLSNSSNNRIFGNNITWNSDGISLFHSLNNTITENDLKANGAGIYLQYSFGNKVFHNNFINNVYQACIENSPDNLWDNDYPSGGNYWSDYTGVDDKSGPNQDQPGSDGKGDTPYIIDVNNVDHYPLMSPYKCGVPVEDPSVSKLAFKVSIEPTGKSEPDEWSFRIVLWDITKRAPDIISLFSQFPGVDLFVSAWDIIVSDKNGDGHLDANEVLDELASQLKDKLTRKIIEQSLSRYLWPLSPEAVEHASEIFTVGLASVIGTVAATEVIQSAASIGFFTGTYSFGIPLLGYQELSGLWEKFPFGGFSGFQQYQVSALSPVDLTVSDIFGRVINKTVCEIPSADYKEFDANGDGDIDVVITLPSINMKYNLTVTPKTGAAPNDDYSVIVENNYISFQIVNSTVAEIPEGGYNAALYTYNPSTYEALEIGYPIQDPLEKIEPYQNVTITVSAISRESEIVNVTLYFSLDNGTTWMPIKMTETVLNIYQAIIPGQQNDTWISYYFVAYDNTGNFTIRDNNGYYYQFYVVPEFPSIVMWLLLMLATLTSIVLAQKREKTNSHS